MSSAPLITSRNYASGVTDENKARCRRPWCNIAIFCASLVTIIGFVVWAVSANDKHRFYKEPISKLTKQELRDIIINDIGYDTGAEDDLVSDLPNLEGTYDFLQFSGYLEATNNRMIHYWFVEAESDPDSKPVFLWTNGGPGCSGLVGFLTEHGPFWVYSDLKLRANEYSWNKLVNMLYVEQPYGVGFSAPTTDECVRGDTEATMDIDALLRSFTLKFPKFASNDLYISSESFGGHYMPRTALTILDNEASGTFSTTLNFKGFMVGNPYTDGYENTIGYMGAIFGHGLTKSDINDEWMENCWGDTTAMDTVYCDELYIVAYTEAYDLNVYALDYPNCPMDEDYTYETYKTQFETDLNIDINDELTDKTPRLSQGYMSHHRVLKKMEKLLERDNLDDELKRIDRNTIETAYNEITTQYQSNSGMPWIACSNYFMERYLNQDSVKEALNVDTSIGWAECSSAVFYGWPESDWDDGMETVYHSIVENYDIKILVFSGDDDSVCGLQGTMYWLDRMGWTEDPDHVWEKWTLNNQLSGFYTKYLQLDGSTAIHFHTVRSAGHMVPSTQPERALALLEKYLYELE